MAATRILCIAILGAVSLCAQDCAVTVFVMSAPPGLPGTALHSAQAAVTEMFARIGVKIEWKWGKVMPAVLDGQCRGPIGVQFDAGEPAGTRRGALAYATPYAESGVQIHVFPDVFVVHDGNRGDVALLAHVMAHEIGHVLEKMDRHSASGIMEEHFSWREICQMPNRPLAFAADDVELIRLALELAHRK